MRIVRKWILIGVLVVIIGSVLVYAISKPREGSLGFHKQEYVAARKAVKGQTLRLRLRKWYAVVTGSSYRVDVFEWGDDIDRMRQHQKALIDLGYLGQDTVEVRTPLSKSLLAKVNRLAEDAIPSGRAKYAQIDSMDLTNITVIAPREDVAKWLEVIRKADMSESGK
jgi:hypothetical protein